MSGGNGGWGDAELRRGHHQQEEEEAMEKGKRSRDLTTIKEQC